MSDQDTININFPAHEINSILDRGNVYISRSDFLLWLSVVADANSHNELIQDSFRALRDTMLRSKVTQR